MGKLITALAIVATAMSCTVPPAYAEEMKPSPEFGCTVIASTIVSLHLAFHAIQTDSDIALFKQAVKAAGSVGQMWYNFEKSPDFDGATAGFFKQCLKAEGKDA